MTDVAHHKHMSFNPLIEIGGRKDRKTYGDVSWHYAGYQQAVAYWLKEINKNRVGSKILQLVRKNIVIIPDPITNAANSAMTFPHNGDDTKLYKTPSKDDKEFTKTWKQAHGHDPLGSGAVIRFTPGKYILDSKVNVQEFGLFAVDDALFHELVHAVRYSHGTARILNHHDLYCPFKDNEEFMAIFITNIYRSCKGTKPDKLRWKYSFPARMKNPNIPSPREDQKTYAGMTFKNQTGHSFTEESFFNLYKNVLIGNYRLMPEIFHAVCDIECEFNPCAAVIDAAKRRNH